MEKIEEYRQPWESEEHWRLRREFLLTHWGKFTENRLLCLAQCYANIELMGCTYPIGVMKQVRALAQGLKGAQHFKELRTKRMSVNFVKANEDDQGKRKLEEEEGWSSANKVSRTSYNQHSFAQGDSKYLRTAAPAAASAPPAQSVRMSAAEFFGFSEKPRGQYQGGEGGYNSSDWSSSGSKHRYSSPRPNYHQVPNQGETHSLSPQFSQFYPQKAQQVPHNSVVIGEPYQRLGGERGWWVRNPSDATVVECLPVVAGCDKNVSQMMATPQSRPQNFYNNGIGSNRNYLEVYTVRVTGAPSPTPLEKKFYQLGRQIEQEKDVQPNVLQLIQVTASRLNLKILFTFDVAPGSNKRSPTFLSCLYIEGVLVGEGRGPSKKVARVTSYTNAVSKLQKPYLRVISNNNGGKLELHSSLTPLNNLGGEAPVMHPPRSKIPEGKIDNALKLKANSETTKVQKHFKFEEFIVLDELEINPTGNAVSVLRLSADFNHVELHYDFNSIGRGNALSLRCQVTLGDYKLGEGFGDCKQAAKLAAATNALEALQNLSYTVKIKARFCDGGHTISKDEVNKSKQGSNSNNSISEDNIGFKLLQMMGWQGGGVGKDSNGIAEPISLKDVYKREGLGYSESRGITKEFMKQVKNIIKKYAESGATHDLVFSSEFSKEERKEIHGIAVRFQLKSISRGGQGPGRHIVLSRRFNPRQLLQHLLESGGETDKYELIPPRMQNRQAYFTD